MLLLSQTLCQDWHQEEHGKEEKTVCVWGNPCHHSPLCFPFRFYEEGSPSLCAKYVPPEGEKRKQTGDFIQDTIFHQVLLLLQALEGNSGNSLSQSISWFCFPSSCPSPASHVQRHVVPQQGRCGAPPSTHTLQPHTLTEVSSSPRREGWWPPAGTCLRTVPGSACCHELLKRVAWEKPGRKAGRASTPIAVCCVKPTRTSFPCEIPVFSSAFPLDL